jgi:hypothetical protein
MPLIQGGEATSVLLPLLSHTLLSRHFQDSLVYPTCGHRRSSWELLDPRALDHASSGAKPEALR